MEDPFPETGRYARKKNGDLRPHQGNGKLSMEEYSRASGPSHVGQLEVIPDFRSTEEGRGVCQKGQGRTCFWGCGSQVPKVVVDCIAGS